MCDTMRNSTKSRIWAVRAKFYTGRLDMVSQLNLLTKHDRQTSRHSILIVISPLLIQAFPPILRDLILHSWPKSRWSQKRTLKQMPDDLPLALTPRGQGDLHHLLVAAQVSTSLKPRGQKWITPMRREMDQWWRKKVCLSSPLNSARI
jgi:hypothetical protein